MPCICQCFLHYIKLKDIYIWQRVAGCVFPTKAINICKSLSITAYWLSRCAVRAHLFLYPWGSSEISYVHFFQLAANLLITIKWKRQFRSVFSFVGLYCQGTPRKRGRNSNVTDKSECVYSMASHLFCQRERPKICFCICFPLNLRPGNA